MRDLFRAFIAVIARVVPGAARREFRAEWDAELASAWTHRRHGSGGAARVVRRALGAIPDAWCLLRQQWSVDMIAQDLRYAVRLLARHRAMTAAATVTLALAIGANAAVFSVLEAVMLRPIAARDPGRPSSPGRPRSTARVSRRSSRIRTIATGAPSRTRSSGLR